MEWMENVVQVKKKQKYESEETLVFGKKVFVPKAEKSQKDWT